MSNRRIDVLFVCSHNAGRSVVAKTLFNDRASKLGLDVRAESAGTAPVKQINPAIRRLLESFTLDPSREKPKSINDAMLSNDPRIVTMGCEVDAESCPAFNFAEVNDWNLPDPSKMSKDSEIVPLIHEIAKRVNTLLQQMIRDGDAIPSK